MTRLRRVAAVVGASVAVIAAGCGSGGSLKSAAVKPEEPISARVDGLLRRMTLDEKIGQMTQVSSSRLAGSPSLVKTYALGSVLSGGDDKPAGNNPAAWRRMVGRFQSQALRTRLHIPLVYGFDAVHGASDVVGATIFPHDIGLGATRDPRLVERIGRAVAEESVGSGVRWTFAPCVCVARTIRWGRTYESFGEDPALVSQLGAALIKGLQGSHVSAAPASVLATAKHYVGDGDTLGGVNAGNAQVSMAQLRRIDLPPYVAAVKNGVATTSTPSTRSPNGCSTSPSTTGKSRSPSSGHSPAQTSTAYSPGSSPTSPNSSSRHDRTCGRVY